MVPPHVAMMPDAPDAYPRTPGAATVDLQHEQLVLVANYVAAASGQLDLALLEARGPAESLGSAMAAIASATRVALAASSANRSGLVSAELRRGIEALQFFDRLTQHVSHVSEFLCSITGRISRRIAQGGPDPSDAAEVVEDDEWKQIRRRLRAELISDAQRELLDLLLPSVEPSRRTDGPSARAYGVPGSVELF
jgi:hypothetical protein